MISRTMPQFQEYLPRHEEGSSVNGILNSPLYSIAFSPAVAHAASWLVSASERSSRALELLTGWHEVASQGIAS